MVVYSEYGFYSRNCTKTGHKLDFHSIRSSYIDELASPNPILARRWAPNFYR
jgi:hypothetical protein